MSDSTQECDAFATHYEDAAVPRSWHYQRGQRILRGGASQDALCSPRRGAQQKYWTHQPCYCLFVRILTAVIYSS